MIRFWVRGLFLVLAMLGFLVLNTHGAQAAPTRTVKFWFQVMDSCQQALPGAALTISGPNFQKTSAVMPGSRVRQIAAVHGDCPLQRGNCVTVPVGCTAFDVPVPATGSAKYTISESTVPRYFVPCLHNQCPGGAEKTFLTVDSTGKASAYTIENGHRGDRRVYPKDGTYNGTPTDPAVLHNWENCRPTFCYTSFH